MPPVEAKIRISSNILREPQVLDNLCPTGGSIARNIMIWASWKGTLKVELNLADFCARMGYDRKHLLRELTPDQKDLMLGAGWPADQLERRDSDGKLNLVNGNCLIAYVLTLMFSRTLPFRHRTKSSKHLHFYNKVMIRELIKCEKRKKGTYIEFVMSDEVLRQARDAYQTIELSDYLSLTTKNGKPDDAAQRMYMRLRWKRRYWDYLEKNRKIEKGSHPSEDSYEDLLAVAGLTNYAQDSLAAHKLRKLLERVGKLESVRMTPTLKLGYPSNLYEVSWRRDKMSAAAQVDEPTEFPYKEEATDKVAAPAPLLTHSAFKSQEAAAPVAKQRATAAQTKQNRNKLLDALADASTSLDFVRSNRSGYYADKSEEQYQQELTNALARVQELQQQLISR